MTKDGSENDKYGKCNSSVCGNHEFSNFNSSPFCMSEIHFDFLLLMKKSKFVEKCWIFF